MRLESNLVESPRFERVCRTSSSEAYLVVTGEELIARVVYFFERFAPDPLRLRFGPEERAGVEEVSGHLVSCSPGSS